MIHKPSRVFLSDATVHKTWSLWYEYFTQHNLLLELKQTHTEYVIQNLTVFYVAGTD